jgi:hypothetical protein
LPPLSLPEADQIVTRPVEWFVINENNYQEVFERLRRQRHDVVLFGLTDNGYENLALNLNDLRTHIEQKNAIIIAYRRYYNETRNILNDAVTINN